VCTINDIVENCIEIEQIDQQLEGISNGRRVVRIEKVPSIKSREQIDELVIDLNYLLKNEEISKMIIINDKVLDRFHVTNFFLNDSPRVVNDIYTARLLDQFSDMQFIPNDLLSDFVSNNFMTNHEVESAIKRSQELADGKFTRRMAYLSLLISSILAIGSSIFNFVTYSNIRNVQITSMPQSSNPIKIILVDETGTPLKVIEVKNDDSIVIKK
jgi:hypothetical protein